jgi:hypothetical protein
MPGIIVEFARFVEVQQRRARAVPQRMPRPLEPSPETNGSGGDDYPSDIGVARRQFDPSPDETAADRGSTTRGSLDG